VEQSSPQLPEQPALQPWAQAFTQVPSHPVLHPKAQFVEQVPAQSSAQVAVQVPVQSSAQAAELVTEVHWYLEKMRLPEIRKSGGIAGAREPDAQVGREPVVIVHRHDDLSLRYGAPFGAGRLGDPGQIDARYLPQAMAVYVVRQREGPVPELHAGDHLRPKLGLEGGLVEPVKGLPYPDVNQPAFPQSPVFRRMLLQGKSGNQSRAGN